ncbi:benzoate membrane transport family protein, partial [Vibrio cholerae HE-46]|jgi:hypothetical protein
LSV